jgi:hypothetical protein
LREDAAKIRNENTTRDFHHEDTKSQSVFVVDAFVPAHEAISLRQERHVYRNSAKKEFKAPLGVKHQARALYIALLKELILSL